MACDVVVCVYGLCCLLDGVIVFPMWPFTMYGVSYNMQQRFKLCVWYVWTCCVMCSVITYVCAVCVDIVLWCYVVL